jgi:hypothetical protein
MLVLAKGGKRRLYNGFWDHFYRNGLVLWDCHGLLNGRDRLFSGRLHNGWHSRLRLNHWKGLQLRCTFALARALFGKAQLDGLEVSVMIVAALGPKVLDPRFDILWQLFTGQTARGTVFAEQAMLSRTLQFFVWSAFLCTGHVYTTHFFDNPT